MIEIYFSHGINLWSIYIYLVISIYERMQDCSNMAGEARDDDMFDSWHIDQGIGIVSIKFIDRRKWEFMYVWYLSS